MGHDVPVTGRPEGVTHWDGPGLDAWEPWSPTEVADRLAAVAVPWQVVGGWAIDLFVGRVTRPHEDLEIAILRTDFDAVRAVLDDFHLHSVGDGEVRRLPDGAEPPPDKHQNWVLEPATQKWRVDVMLEAGDRDTWVCRRDESIRVGRAEMTRTTGEGIPYLAPAGALLYKAKGLRPKDQADFDVCVPLLTDAERGWLVDALGVAHPGHVWIDQLG
jgi:hypothetical protein